MEFLFRSMFVKLYLGALIAATLFYSHVYLSFLHATSSGHFPGTMPGWLSASRNLANKKSEFDLEKVSVISWKPRIFLHKNFLTFEECDYLIKKSGPRLNRSTVADKKDGRELIEEARTSYSMFFQKNEDEIISRIEDRIAKWSLLDKSHQEPLEVSRYKIGQINDRHFDYFVDPANVEYGGHRSVTVLMYLNDVEEGGETAFPEAKFHSHYPSHANFSQCANSFLAVKPKKGNALLFHNLRGDCEIDDMSVHFSCPVIKGIKWVAVKWIHIRRYDEPLCEDDNSDCPSWAKDGECEKNPEYMSGIDGRCRKSCKACNL